MRGRDKSGSFMGWVAFYSGRNPEESGVAAGYIYGRYDYISIFLIPMIFLNGISGCSALVSGERWVHASPIIDTCLITASWNMDVAMKALHQLPEYTP